MDESSTCFHTRGFIIEGAVQAEHNGGNLSSLLTDRGLKESLRCVKLTLLSICSQACTAQSS